MLELDLRLVPFVEKKFLTLRPEEQEAYEELLAKEDWQIYDWLRGVGSPDCESLKLIVNTISAFNHKASKD